MRRTILIHQPDPHLRSLLAESLASLAGGVRVLTAGKLDGALRLLAASAVDLVVTDLAVSSMDGFAVAMRVLQTRPDVPLVALVRDGSPPLSRDIGERHLRTLRKPVEASLFRDTVSELLPPTPRGYLSGVSAAGLLQLLNLEARSVVVVLETPGGSGRLFIESGQLVDAQAFGARGEEAVYRLAGALSRPETAIVLEDLAGPVERTIHRPLDGVLLEAAKRRDEQVRTLASSAPPPEAMP